MIYKCELLVFNLSNITTHTSLSKELIYDVLLDYGQSYFQQTLIRVELGFTFVFVYLEGQQLIQYEVG